MTDISTYGDSSVRSFAYSPGINNSVPEGKEGSITVFGNLPKGLGIVDILCATDIEGQSLEDPSTMPDKGRIEIIIPPLGQDIEVVLKTPTSISRQSFKIGPSIILIGEVTTGAVHKSLAGRYTPSDDGNNGETY